MTISLKYRRGRIFKEHTRVKHHHRTNTLHQSPQLLGDGQKPVAGVCGRTSCTACTLLPAAGCTAGRRHWRLPPKPLAQGSWRGPPCACCSPRAGTGPAALTLEHTSHRTGDARGGPQPTSPAGLKERPFFLPEPQPWDMQADGARR